jgi:hypothetical protein
MFSKFSALGFAEKFLIGVISVGLLVTVYDWFSKNNQTSSIESAQQKCLKEAEELKANALPHEVWKKVPPVCDAPSISKLEQKTPTQQAILEMNDDKKTDKSFPSLIWFVIIGFIPMIIRLIRRQMNKIDKNG